MKKAEDGNELIVRLAEIEGKETIINLRLPVDVSSVRRLNLIELPLENASQPTVNGKTIHLKIKPNEIVTLGITW